MSVYVLRVVGFRFVSICVYVFRVVDISVYVFRIV